MNLPFKSVAGALLFCVLLGPIGLLYSSALGGAIMIFLALIVMCSSAHKAIVLVWLISCIWGVASVNRYNQKLLQKN